MRYIIIILILLAFPSVSMAELTEHQLFHLNAILNEQAEDKKDDSMILKLAAASEKTEASYLIYLDLIQAEVNKIIAKGVFPVGIKPSDIHDYLEDID